MKIIKTDLEGCVILEPRVFNDHRGSFIESYNQATLNELLGFDVNFVQDNESTSSYGVLRGLHYQRGKFAQAKLVRVVNGKVLDVAVDIRLDSDTFGKHVAIELSGENKRQLFVPRGFAHGFIALSENVIFSYKCDNFYNKEFESGLIYNDPQLKIDWILPESEYIISEKDLLLPKLVNAQL